MTERERFEEWVPTMFSGSWSEDTGVLKKDAFHMWMGWQACAEIKDKEIKALEENNDFINEISLQNQKQIVEQDKEIAELKREITMLKKWAREDS